MKNLIFFYSLKTTEKLLFNFIFFLLLVYFVFHTIYGNRGLIAYLKLNQKLEKAHEKLKSLRIERVENEHRAKLLKEGDKDIIDEKARDILGVASPKEQVFTTEDKNNN